MSETDFNETEITEINDLDRLYEEFIRYGGPLSMTPVTKYTTWRIVEYNRVMNIRSKWHDLAMILLKYNLPTDLKNKIWHQAVQFNLTEICDLCE
jgi:hypothetical protein